MRHYWGQHIIQLYRMRKKWDITGGNTLHNYTEWGRNGTLLGATHYTIIQNEEEMRHYWGQHIIQLYRMRKKWDNGGQHILTATGKVWRVWVGIKIICPCVAVPMWLLFQNLQRNLEHVALSKQDTHYGPLVASCFITWQPLIERASHFCHLWTFWAALRVMIH